SLPPALVAALGLRWQSFGRGILADGSECLFDVYEAKVVWDRRSRRLLVDEADTTPLVGTALLTGYELKVQSRARGKVTIKPTPKPGAGPANSARVKASGSTPRPMASGELYSSGRWLIPSLHGMKIMPVGQRRAMKSESW